MAITCGRQVVATAGDIVQVVNWPKRVKHIDIVALPSNTNRVYLGCSNVRAAAGQESGWPLEGTETLTFTDIDLATVFMDAVVDGEGVCWGAEYE